MRECRNHTHPRLAKAIPEERFFSEVQEVLLRAKRGAGSFPTVRLVLERPIQVHLNLDAHRRSARRYAEMQTGKKGTAFYFSPAVLWLPSVQRLGVIAHEVGHLIAFGMPGGENHTEGQADYYAWAVARVQIKYDLRWPGRGLQTGRRR